VRVHVINLDRSAERLAEFASTNRHLSGVERFSAVDGRSLDIPSLTRQGLVAEDILGMYTAGALGDAMSNMALWDIAIARGETLTICEDDAIFNQQFELCAEQMLAGLPPDWGVILWGWNFDFFLSFEMLPGVSYCLAQFDQDRMRLGTRVFQTQSPSPQAYKLLWSFGTPCYTVSARGAAELKRRLLPFRPSVIPCPFGVRARPGAPFFRTVGFEVALNAFWKDLNAFVCFPPLVITRNEHATSTIQEYAAPAASV
jgi:glycosyl transferase family 25